MIKYLHPPLVESFISKVLLHGFLCWDVVPAFCIFSLERRCWQEEVGCPHLERILDMWEEAGVQAS